MTGLIQRLDAGDVWDVIKGPIFRNPFGGLGGILDGPGTELAFDAMVASNRSDATPFPVPQSSSVTTRSCVTSTRRRVR